MAEQWLLRKKYLQFYGRAWRSMLQNTLLVTSINSIPGTPSTISTPYSIQFSWCSGPTIVGVFSSTTPPPLSCPLAYTQVLFQESTGHSHSNTHSVQLLCSIWMDGQRYTFWKIEGGKAQVSQRGCGESPSLKLLETCLGMVLGNLLWVILDEQGHWAGWSPEVPSCLSCSVKLSGIFPLKEEKRISFSCFLASYLSLRYFLLVFWENKSVI